MMHFLYNLSIYFYVALIRVAALFHPKAKLWVAGRKDVFSQLSSWRKSTSGHTVWIHCASLGEFEQGRPVIEKIKLKHPEFKIVLSFFSPSGFEVRKKYSGADLVIYLPPDTPSNAEQWLEILQPQMVFFVKYEIWANYFLQLKRRKIPLYLISAIFRPNHRFFGMQKTFWKPVLASVHHFYVQNQESQTLLHHLGLHQTTVSGDTRYDRVLDVAKKAQRIVEIEQFKGQRKCIVVGSSYNEEEKSVQRVFQRDDTWCVIIAPHYIEENRLKEIEQRFGSDACRFSEKDNKGDTRVLIMDNMGMLSSVYAYGDIAIVGGGFGGGIHNILEPAVYGIPVLFGPNFKRFAEAVAMIQEGGATSVDTVDEMGTVLLEWMQSHEERLRRGKIAGQHVQKGSGALDKIIETLDFQGK